MESVCRSPNCPWTGAVRDLYDHCEVYHPRCIVTIDDENAFTVKFSGFLEETFLLVCNGGLYWLLLDPLTTPGFVRRGIFPIGNSETCEYTIKIGRTGDASITYVGPCQMGSVTTPRYDLECSASQITTHAQSNVMQIFFGQFCDTDVSMDEDITAEEIEFFDGRLKDFDGKLKDFSDDFANNTFKCLVCYDEEWSKPTCPICRPDASLDFVDLYDDEQLMKCLTQFSEITQMMQMAA